MKALRSSSFATLKAPVDTAPFSAHLIASRTRSLYLDATESALPHPFPTLSPMSSGLDLAFFVHRFVMQGSGSMMTPAKRNTLRTPAQYRRESKPAALAPGLLLSNVVENGVPSRRITVSFNVVFHV
jgi:hypothetical protein